GPSGTRSLIPRIGVTLDGRGRRQGPRATHSGGLADALAVGVNTNATFGPGAANWAWRRGRGAGGAAIGINAHSSLLLDDTAMPRSRPSPKHRDSLLPDSGQPLPHRLRSRDRSGVDLDRSHEGQPACQEKHGKKTLQRMLVHLAILP